jgi:hypothetical protein
MPNVRGKQFDYTPEGRESANKYRALLERMKQRRDPRSRGGEIGVAAELDAGSENPMDATVRMYRDRIDRAIAALPPHERTNPRARENAIASVDPRRKYGEWGYAGETRRQHEDRLWDRDWDEDRSGRRWDPRSAMAGRR